jgi:hypothetical protein
MNELYKAREPELPPIPNLPPLPTPRPGERPSDDYIYFKRSTLLIIIILVGILMFGIQFMNDYRNAHADDMHLKVYCEPPLPNAWRPTVDNNMQASHSYNNSVLRDSNIPGAYCIMADDWGNLYGSSMQPTFFEGNSVFLRNFTNGTVLKTGDVIRFYRFTKDFPNCTALQDAVSNGNYHGGGAWVNNSMAVIHRVNAVYDDHILAQGDNLYEQENVDRCQITGVAVGILFT